MKALLFTSKKRRLRARVLFSSNKIVSTDIESGPDDHPIVRTAPASPGATGR